MKVESRTIIGAAIFLAILCAGYWVLVEGYGHSAERSGITMLLFSFCAYGMLGGYLAIQLSRRKGHPRPEDAFDATQSDGAGLIGFFPAASIWPAGLGLGMVFGAAALVWGLWYLVIGGVIFAGAAMGWVIESDYSEDVVTGSPLESADSQH